MIIIVRDRLLTPTPTPGDLHDYHYCYYYYYYNDVQRTAKPQTKIQRIRSLSHTGS